MIIAAPGACWTPVAQKCILMILVAIRELQRVIEIAELDD
jgi:hypothetical protein